MGTTKKRTGADVQAQELRINLLEMQLAQRDQTAVELVKLTEQAERERDAAAADAERYLHAFAHRHQTWLTGGDDCKKCGLDLRDPIHSQAAIDAAIRNDKP
jgi:cyanophycinase-like exopeptidase